MALKTKAIRLFTNMKMNIKLLQSECSRILKISRISGTNFEGHNTAEGDAATIEEFFDFICEINIPR